MVFQYNVNLHLPNWQRAYELKDALHLSLWISQLYPNILLRNRFNKRVRFVCFESFEIIGMHGVRRLPNVEHY